MQGSGRTLLSATFQPTDEIDNREKYLKGARIAYQSEDGYVRWKNDDGTYAIQTLNNDVHLNVQENQLSLSPSVVHSSGANVIIIVSKLSQFGATFKRTKKIKQTCCLSGKDMDEFVIKSKAIM